MSKPRECFGWKASLIAMACLGLFWIILASKTVSLPADEWHCVIESQFDGCILYQRTASKIDYKTYFAEHE